VKINFSSLQRLSLAARVTSLVGLTFLSCVVMLGVVVQNSINNHFLEQDAGELNVVATSVQRAVGSSARISPDDALQDRLEHAVAGHHGVYYAVYSDTGHAIFATPGPTMSNLLESVDPVEQVSMSELHQWTEGNETYRGAVLMLDPDDEFLAGYRIAVASNMDFHLRFMENFQTTLWSMLICASLVILLSAWFAVKFAHKPLHKISEEMSTITTEKLSLRLPPEAVPIDLVELVMSFNKLIGRMEESFQKLANFSADIAHELRTPITNLTTQVQVSLSKGRDAAEYREILYSNLEEYERMARMINDMLWLAQSDNGTLRPSFEDIDARAELLELFDYLSAWAEERDITLTVEGKSPPLRGDRAMLRRALTNLLTNAVRHADSGTSIQTRLATDKHFVLISIENLGEEIPAEHLPKIFDRFHRVDASRQSAGSGGREGSAGLGLAIVSSIIDIHGGAISVTSHDRRTVFHIRLPLIPPN
jgi:two-component system heavy metal sensor histidine kinase CusS